MAERAGVSAPACWHCGSPEGEVVALAALREIEIEVSTMTDVVVGAGHPEGGPDVVQKSQRTSPLGGVRRDGPGAARAVGQAMRVNPMPIVVPCHRIVGQASGSGGFSGSTGRSHGMWIKTKLLELEQPA